ncbi:MAG: putative metal-binding motif-containing protein, partial [Chitinophagales bacterium]|nr:putative metal-binding motif-containing protein [Chitinophagales bacterium]
MLFCLEAFAQNFSIIGTGTTANTSTSYPAPFGNFYWGARHQFFVTAAQLSAAGIPAGASIQSLGFNVTATNGAGTHNSFQILVYKTTSTNPISTAWFSGTPAASTTPVNHLPVVGWNQFSFNTPFTWYGENLIIETCFNNSSYTWNASTQWTTTLSGATFSRWYRADAAGVCASIATTGTSTTTRPNMRIGWVAATPCAGPINPGNTLSTANPVCSGANFTLSMSSPPTSSGITFQWQSSPDGMTWSNIAGATNATYTTSQTTATWYQCVVTCTNDASTGTSTPLQVTMASFLSCYCTPSYTTGTGAGDYISLVQLNGSVGSINNSTGGSTAPYYTYYAPGPNTTTTLYPGLSYTITMAPGTWSGSGNNLFAWIDYDQSGSFTAGEQIAVLLNLPALTPGNVTFTVPFTALTGTTRLRVREVYANTAADPCLTYTYGETEDYDITIAVPVGCFGMPNPGNTVASANPACPNVNFTLSLQNPPSESALAFQWQSSLDGVTFSDIAGATNPTLTISQNVVTWYQCVVTCTNTNQTAISTPLQVTLADPCFCNPYCAVTNAGSACITNVTLNTLNNTTPGCEGAGNYNFQSATTTLVAGGAYTFSITTDGNAITSVWFDWNNDGIFSPSEWYQPYTSGTSGSITILVPVSSYVGNVRMRVRSRLSGNPNGPGDACLIMGSGETEDYCIQVVAPVGCSGMPNPGNTLASSNPACPGVNFTLSLQNPPSEGGLTFQWQSSSDGITFTDIAGATNFTHVTSQTTVTWYQCVVTCTNTGDVAISNPVQVTLGDPCLCNPYCSVTNAGTACITNVTLHTLNNTTPGCQGAGNYNFQSATTTLATGISYTFSITTDGNAITSVWFDWNNDGIFSPTEWYQPYTSGTSGSITITVPMSSYLGNVRMRVRSRLSGNPNGPGDACLIMGSGETEDYCILVVAGTSCSGMPNPGNTLSTQNPVCVGENFTLSLQNPPSELGLTFQWQSSGDGIVFTDIAGATNPTYTTTQSSATWYQCVVTCTNTGDVAISTPIQITMDNFLGCYCIPTYTSGTGAGDYISFVELIGDVGSISNATGGAPSPYYTFYPPGPGTTTQLSASLSYTLTLAPGTWSGSGNNLFAWIDFNQNGTFEASEQIAAILNQPAMTPASVTFTVPVLAASGTTMLRVREIYAATVGDPCASAGFGETEDYYVTIVPATPCSGLPNPGNTLASANPVCAGVNFTLSLQNPPSESGLTFQWQSSADGIVFTNILGATNPTLTISQSAATWYQCVVTCTNTNDVANSAPILVSMQAPTNCYCTPTYTVGTGAGDYISYVELIGDAGGITNSTGASSAPYYTFYAPGAGTTTTLTGGLNYTITLAPGTWSGSGNNLFAWIDFNQDGDFYDSGELIASFFNIPALTNASTTFTVPFSAVNGNTRLRVREMYAATAGDPCANHSFGETEDYVITIAPADPSFTGLPTDMCIDASPVQLFPANPTATFSGPGVIFFGGDWYFDPASAGVGTHTITCTVGSQSSSQNVTVHPLPVVTMCGIGPFCDVDAPVALTCGTPAGGIYLGAGVYDDGMGNYYFDPATAGPGTHVVIYLYTDAYGCSGFDFTQVDVNASSVWYADADGDGYGDNGSSVAACAQPSGYVADNTDCNDNNASVNPGVAEVCYNGIDDNCNGQVDENDVTATVSPAGPMSVCGGVPVTLSAVASGPGTITYQWYRGLTAQSGATSASYTTTKKGTFYVAVSNGICTTISNLVSISRIPAPPANITNVTGTNDLCAAGGSITLKANGTAYTYQWKKDGNYTGQTTK